MISTFYRGTVKDLLTLETTGETARAASLAVFEFNDAFRLEGWGRMPESFPQKGEASAILASAIFERLEDPKTWQDYSKTAGALALRKANRLGAVFNELGEELQKVGLRTHYRGILSPPRAGSNQSTAEIKDHLAPEQACSIADLKIPSRWILVDWMSSARPEIHTLLGETVADYHTSHQKSRSRMIPLKLIFKMEWDFPVLQFFTKWEGSDRLVSLAETLALSGISAGQLQEVLLKTAWVAGWLRHSCQQLGFELQSGELEWAVLENGSCLLADGIGLEELGLFKKSIPFSKNFLELYYKNTSWFLAVEKAKILGKAQRNPDWKRSVLEPIPPLTAYLRELTRQIYFSFTEVFTERSWFPESWPLERVLFELNQFSESRFS